MNLKKHLYVTLGYMLLTSVGFSAENIQGKFIPKPVEILAKEYPDETVFLNPQSYKSGIKNIVQFVCNQTSDFDKISDLTPDEGRKLLEKTTADLLSEHKFTQETLQEKLNIIFSDNFFGVSPSILLTPQKIWQREPYTKSHLWNFFTYGCGLASHEQPKEIYWRRDVGQIKDYDLRLFSEGQYRWNLTTRFLDPQFVREQFTKSYPKLIQEADPKLVDEVFSDKHFGVPQDPQARLNYFQTTHISFLPHDMLENIYQTASRIMGYTSQGDVLICFGNTPVYVYRALMHLVSKDSKDANFRQLISFPFSGTPNRVRQIFSKRDLVTQERLNHLLMRMEKSGIWPNNPNVQNNTTYVIDVMASGGGPSYMMWQLIKACQKQNFVPKLATITLNQVDVNNPQSRNMLIAKHNAKDGQRHKFYFPSVNNPVYAVENLVVYLQDHAGLDMIPDTFRVLPEYNASFWTSFYDYLLTQKPQEHTQIVLEYADTHFQMLRNKPTSDVSILKQTYADLIQRAINQDDGMVELLKALAWTIKFPLEARMDVYLDVLKKTQAYDVQYVEAFERWVKNSPELDIKSLDYLDHIKWLKECHTSMRKDMLQQYLRDMKYAKFRVDDIDQLIKEAGTTRNRYVYLRYQTRQLLSATEATRYIGRALVKRRRLAATEAEVLQYQKDKQEQLVWMEKHKNQITPENFDLWMCVLNK